MVGQVDTQLAFWLFGVGSLLGGVALIWRLIARGSPVQPEATQDATRSTVSPARARREVITPTRRCSSAMANASASVDIISG